jgi:diaminohydroxyphosphoribosylaminopyrimidine deaminase/5-amino-6-(5-phosphoribosylamino)uracil reductase
MLTPTNIVHTDENFMQRCIQLAMLGAGYTHPNPMVGAVLVHNNTIIGEGWHNQYGGAHAEVNCIHNVPKHLTHLIHLSTLYVSLEPCAHYGKTPPCAALLIQHKIPRVVIGITDPHNKVAGKGIQMLKESGIAVTVGVLEHECRMLNKHFFTFHEKQRPYIILKWAMTQDKFIAPINGGNVRISNTFTQLLLHKWRGTIPAFVVGFNTVVQDNPKLSNRLWKNAVQPTRVILDPKNELPCKSYIFDGEQATLIYNQHFQMDGEITQWIKVDQSDFIEYVIQDLALKNIQSIVVEGGTKTLQQFINKGLYDEIIIFQNTALLENGVKAPIYPTTDNKDDYFLNDNIVTHYYY